jgi:hypothetical protein
MNSARALRALRGAAPSSSFAYRLRQGFAGPSCKPKAVEASAYAEARLRSLRLRNLRPRPDYAKVSSRLMRTHVRRSFSGGGGEKRDPLGMD